MNVELAILQHARALIEPFGNWTQRASARSRSGAFVNVDSKVACQFCAAGAVERAAWNSDMDGYWAACERLSAAACSRGFGTLAQFNDAQPHTPDGHAAVLALFDEAIAQAKEVSNER